MTIWAYVAESINKLLQKDILEQIIHFTCLCEDFQAEVAFSRVDYAFDALLCYIPVEVCLLHLGTGGDIFLLILSR